MSYKSTIEPREYVPQYFGNNRDFQVFLNLLKLILTNVVSNTNNFITNLLNPLACKSRLLPLLCNNVGYDYDSTERIITNRWICKLYPLLIRNRGNDLGIKLAISLALSLLAEDDDLQLDKNFSIDYGESIDKYGRSIKTLKVYLYTSSYNSILNKLIDVVRPAGLYVEFVPSQSISSSETIVLTDDTLIAKYDYTTGKLLSINGIDIYIQNSWDVMSDDDSNRPIRWKDLEPYKWGELEDAGITWGYLEKPDIEKYEAIPGLAPYEVGNKHNYFYGETLVDGRFYDRYGQDLNKYIDESNGYIMNSLTGQWTGEVVKETKIYAHKPNKDNTGFTSEEYYTGKYFDVSNPAKVLKTYYKLYDDTLFRGFYVNHDTLTIHDNIKDSSALFSLKEDIMTINGKPIPILKVYDSTGKTKYNWHVELSTRKFIKDLDGVEINSNTTKMPFTNTTYIGKKAYIMSEYDLDGITYITSTPFFVNKYGDIVDLAGHIILTKQDRYKISDSNMIGFSEIHNNTEPTTYDATNILGRDYSFLKDDDIKNTWSREELNDHPEYDRINDARYKLTREMFNIGNPIREYTGTDLIRMLSSDDLKHIYSENGYFEIPLFINSFDKENSSGKLIIYLDLPNNFSLGDIFKTIQLKYESSNPNTKLDALYDIDIYWTANTLNRSYFNLNELPNPIKFLNVGKINKRTLHWNSFPIVISPNIRFC